MTKKSLDRKAAQKFILDNRINNKTDQEIYNELTLEYYDKKSVALLITATVRAENKIKFKNYNNALLILLGLSIIFKLMTVFTLTLQTGQIWTLLLVFIVPLFAGYFMLEIAKYNGPAYRFCGLLTIAGFMQTVGKVDNETDLIISLLFSGAIAGLSFYLDRKLFPDYSPSNLKKDVSGEYLLNGTQPTA